MMKRNVYFLLFLISIGIASANAAGAAPVDSNSLVTLLITNMATVTSTLSSKAIIWLGAFATVQFIVTNIGLLKSGGDIEQMFGKLIGSLMWIGFCTYVLANGPDFIASVGDDFFAIPGLTIPTAGTIMSNTAKTAAVLGALAIPVGFASNTIGMFMVYLILIILAIGCFFAFKIFMLQLELGLVVMLSPLSFSFLGLNALKDQGIAPFKSLISLGYRIILIGLILSAFNVVDESVRNAFASFTEASIMDGIGNVIETLFAALGSYLLLMYLIFKSDSIAASLAGGTTSMGTADVASAAAMGASAGAAAVLAPAAAMGTASKPIESMSSFMGKMGFGGGGSISNAGGGGTGGGVAKPSAAAAPSASLSGGKSPVGSSDGPMPGTAADTGHSEPPADAAPGGRVDENGAVPAAPGGDGSGKDGLAGASGGDGASKADAPSTSPVSSLGDTPANGDFTKGLEMSGGGGGGSAANAPIETPASAPGAPSSGGASAGVGGPPGLADLVKQLQDMGLGGGQKSPTFADKLGAFGKHVEQEKAHTSVSISTHHAD